MIRRPKGFLIFYKGDIVEFSDFCFVFVKPEYLKALHDADSEIFYSTDTDYSQKPHLGILTTCNNRKYVIPLTSAKRKHANWRDITATNYRIYEEIDTRTAVMDAYDIIVDETNTHKLRQRGISEGDFQFYKKRILSILEIKKMFPVIDGVYYIADLSSPTASIEDEQRRNLMIKEYFFCKKYKEQIQAKAKTIYEKQMATGVVAPYHCNFGVLEAIADTYKIPH